MGLRFRKSFSICKGVRVNLSNSGTSLSVGKPGARMTLNSKGRLTSTVGIPGSGLSYSTSANLKGNNSSKSIENKTVQATAGYGNINADYEENVRKVQEFNEYLDRIRSIHKIQRRPVDWIYIRDALQSPFNPSEIGPKETMARQNISSQKTGFFNRLFTSQEEKQQQAEREIMRAREEDMRDYESYQSLKQLSYDILDGNIDAYYRAVSEVHPFDDILEFGSDFEIGTDSPNFIEVEFHVKSENVVPAEILTLTKTGKLSQKKMTKTMHYDITQDYICSCAIRTAKEMFSLLPVKRVIIHAVEPLLNTASGFVEDAAVLSVLIEREHFESLNLDMVDPSDMIESCKVCHMDFKKTQGLKKVQRIDYRESN